MDGVRSYASRPRDDTILGRDQSERSRAEYWQRLYDMGLQTVGVYTHHNQMGSPFRVKSPAPDKDKR